MEFKIFDYANKIKWCSIPEDEKPCAILISVISGDETVVVFTDADKLYQFESSNTRFTDYNDGAYLLRDAENIAVLIGLNGSLVAARKMQYILI